MANHSRHHIQKLFTQIALFWNNKSHRIIIINEISLHYYDDHQRTRLFYLSDKTIPTSLLALPTTTDDYNFSIIHLSFFLEDETPSHFQEVQIQDAFHNKREKLPPKIEEKEGGYCRRSHTISKDFTLVIHSWFCEKAFSLREVFSTLFASAKSTLF